MAEITINEMKDVKDLTEFKKLITAVNKQNLQEGKPPKIMEIADLEPTYLIPTGIEQLDAGLCGGIPRGMTTAFWGAPNCGKTSSLLTMVKGILKRKGIVVWIDTENLGVAVIEAFGIDPKDPNFYLISSTESGDEMLDAVNFLLFDDKKAEHRGLVDLIVVDSITNLATQADINSIEDKGLGGNGQLGRLPALLAKWTTQITGRNMLGKGPNATALVLIAQQRANVGDAYNPVQMSGGNAVKHNPKVVAKFSRLNNIQKIKPGEKDKSPFGHDVAVEITKITSGVGVPTKIRYSVIYGVGVDDTEAIYKKGEIQGYIQKAGMKFTCFLITNKEKELTKIMRFEGKKAEVLSYLTMNSDLKDTLKEQFLRGKYPGILNIKDHPDIIEDIIPDKVTDSEDLEEETPLETTETNN